QSGSRHYCSELGQPTRRPLPALFFCSALFRSSPVIFLRGEPRISTRWSLSGIIEGIIIHARAGTEQSVSDQIEKDARKRRIASLRQTRRRREQTCYSPASRYVWPWLVSTE